MRYPALFLVLCLLTGPACHRKSETAGQTLSAAQTQAVQGAADLMRSHGLTTEAHQADQLLQSGLWRAALPNDQYLAGAEKSGDTPYAYTLADGHTVHAVVLAPRFFSGVTPAAQAALMIHEMGHVRAYQTRGQSDEYDGYKAEYDTHARLGLSETDGLVYFAMLDGVVQAVVPREPAYKSKSDINDYLAQTH